MRFPFTMNKHLAVLEILCMNRDNLAAAGLALVHTNDYECNLQKAIKHVDLKAAETNKRIDQVKEAIRTETPVTAAWFVRLGEYY